MVWYILIDKEKIREKLIILGIDPGYATVGFGVLAVSGGGSFEVLDYGAVTTNPSALTPSGRAKIPPHLRLLEIYRDFTELFRRYTPDAAVVEKLYFNSNTTTAMGVSQARGVLLLTAAEAGAEVAEYTPLQVKSAVTGYGRADKPQVQEMTRRFLGLKEIPKPDDAADALAIALAYGRLHKRQTTTEAAKRLRAAVAASVSPNSFR